MRNRGWGFGKNEDCLSEVLCYTRNGTIARKGGSPGGGGLCRALLSGRAALAFKRCHCIASLRAYFQLTALMR